jgi:outer membrane protein insertion porin family
LPNGLDVTFEVTEMKRLTGSYNTMVGNNEGSMVREYKHHYLSHTYLQERYNKASHNCCSLKPLSQ